MRAKKMFIAAAVVTALCACVIALACSGARTSYSVTEQYAAPQLGAVALANSAVAVLPILTQNGQMTHDELDAETLYNMLVTLRPDLVFASHEKYISAFPPRFDRRQLNIFYSRLHSADENAVAGMDSLWGFTAQDLLLVHSIRDGAVVHGANGAYFKHVLLVSELWGRETRRVMRRVSCRGVSDLRGVDERELVLGCLERLARTLPAASPIITGRTGQQPAGAAGW